MPHRSTSQKHTSDPIFFDIGQRSSLKLEERPPAKLFWSRKYIHACPALPCPVPFHAFIARLEGSRGVRYLSAFYCLFRIYIIYIIISLAIRQWAARSSTWIAHNFPERKEKTSETKGNPCTKSTSLPGQLSACLLYLFAVYCIVTCSTLLLYTSRDTTSK